MNEFENINIPHQRSQTQKAKHGTAVVILCCVLSAVIGVVSSTVIFNLADKDDNIQIPSQQNTETTSNVNISIDETASSIAEAVAIKASDSVVGIRTTTAVTSFFGGSGESTGTGSGVIYSSDGYIITNYHVIEEAANSRNSKIEVFVENETENSYQATVVGYNISTDLAVLKIDAKGLQAVEIGDSDELKVGQYVITIGAPGGLEFMDSVTYGIISGLDRVVSTDSSLKLIQTDAAINPGNSGGALLDSQGRLIGINSSKIVAEEFEGMGFAIPVGTVVEKCNKIIARENEPTPYIGISVSEKYTSQVLAYYGYPSGAVVLSVADDSPAHKAGISRGDIITKFNGTEIEEYTQLDDIINDLDPGSKVEVEIYRSGKYYKTNIEVISNAE